MAKSPKSTRSDAAANDAASRDSLGEVSFEDAIAALEQIVGELEEGRLGLDDSLEHYEHGMKHLRHCYQLLECAERKIELLQSVDQNGQIETESFVEDDESLEVKAKSRGRRRTSQASAGRPRARKPAGPPPSDSDDSDDADDNNVDAPGALF